MKMTILLKERVKPSTPTPPHLKDYNLSIFDQMYGGSNVEFVLFYKTPPPENHNQLLKKALSETLTLFHPLAGEVTPDSSSTSVHCSDNGILYVEARANTPLNKFFENPDLSKLKTFLQGHDGSTPGSIHVTTFDCGGVAIGASLPHKLFDAAGMTRFLVTWATIARGGNIKDERPLDFTSASLMFPPQNPFPQELLEHLKNIIITKGEFLHKRFMLDAKSIAAIKTKAVSEAVPNPTRVESLTAFFWKHMMLAKRAVKGISTSYSCIATHTADLRPRLDPPLPNAFGNLAWSASVTYELSSTGGGAIELSHLVEKVREMFESFKGENLKSLQGDGVYIDRMDLMTNPEKLRWQRADNYLFTSWCRLGLNNIDFGWGKPIWIAPIFMDPSYPVNVEKVIFVDSGSSSDGIEAWMLRNKEEMLVLENDEEFLLYATPDPSIHECT